MNRWPIIAAGVAATFAETALWHGPFGAGERFAAKIERAAGIEIGCLEMLQIKAELAREPLRRTLVLGGPADEFQHQELARMLGQQPGVGSVVWAVPPVDWQGTR